jgi:hypothetical protein
MKKLLFLMNYSRRSSSDVDLSELADNREPIDGHLSNYAEIDELENLRAAIVAESTAEKSQAATSLDLVTLRRFSEAVSARLLSAWRFPMAIACATSGTNRI